MHTRIPLPSIENPQFKDVMDYWAQLKQAQTQREQFAQKLATQKEQFGQNYGLEQQKLAAQQKQFGQTYGLQKQAQDRANSLLPYMVQQYKDIHKRDLSDAEIKEVYNNLIKNELAKISAPNTTAPSSVPGTTNPSASQNNGELPVSDAQPKVDNRQQLQNFLQQNPNLPDDQKAQINQFMQTLPQAGVNPNQTPGLPALLPGNQPSTPAGGLPALLPGNQPSTPAGGLPALLSQGQPSLAASQPPMPTAAQPSNSAGNQVPSTQQMSPGQEYEVRAGNPALSKLDKVAGLVPGIPKPDVHYTPNGMIETRYPSGRITLQNISSISGMKTVANETPEERQARDIQTKSDIANDTAASKLISAGHEGIKTAERAIKIGKLIVDNPEMTGILPGLLSSFNLSQNSKLGEVEQTANKLQGDMARYGSQRGGAQALQWAGRSKPSKYRQADYNLGMIKSIYDDAKSDYQDMADEYKNRTGKEYPIKFPELPASFTKKMNEIQNEKSSKVSKNWELVNGVLTLMG